MPLRPVHLNEFGYSTLGEVEMLNNDSFIASCTYQLHVKDFPLQFCEAWECGTGSHKTSSPTRQLVVQNLTISMIST